jgi:hypothetical protein
MFVERTIVYSVKVTKEEKSDKPKNPYPAPFGIHNNRAIGFGTRIMGTELYKDILVVQKG